MNVWSVLASYPRSFDLALIYHFITTPFASTHERVFSLDYFTIVISHYFFILVLGHDLMIYADAQWR
jgi:hypothetical protein